MITSFNTEAFNEAVGFYLKMHSATRRMFICCPDDAGWFFGEMMHRFMAKRIALDGMLGPGDLSLLSLDPIQDYNAEVIAYASMQTVKAHYFRDKNSQLEDRIEEALILSVGLDSIHAGVYMSNMAYLAIQEQAGLILLNLYMSRGGAGSNVIWPFDKYDPCSWLRYAILCSQDAAQGMDWKQMRCLFYRYLMYCGFIAVDDNCRVMKDYIPKLPALTGLADRFIEITGLRKAWNRLDLPSLDSMDVELDPEGIAKQFLRFNKIEA